MEHHWIWGHPHASTVPSKTLTKASTLSASAIFGRGRVDTWIPTLLEIIGRYQKAVEDCSLSSMVSRQIEHRLGLMMPSALTPENTPWPFCPSSVFRHHCSHFNALIALKWLQWVQCYWVQCHPCSPEATPPSHHNTSII